MSIEGIRASLNSDALKTFDNALSNIHYCDDVNNSIIDFQDAKNFIFKAEWNVKPHNGLTFIKDGNVAGTYCY